MKETEKNFLKIKEISEVLFRIEERKGKIKIEGEINLNDFSKEYIIKLIWNDTKEQR